MRIEIDDCGLVWEDEYCAMLSADRVETLRDLCCQRMLFLNEMSTRLSAGLSH
jgi:hypothetical protein